jgi:methionyl-tRNA formyltransferase
MALQQPQSLKPADVQSSLAAIAVDVWVVAAYGIILPQALLGAARFGAINVHASLLPRWRGAAPIQRAIMAGDTQTGISIMQMDAGLDTGPVYLQRVVPILSDDNAATVHDRLAEVGARALVEVLERLGQEGFAATHQPVDGATYASKLNREDTVIDWSKPATTVVRMIQALDPSPGAQTSLAGTTVKVWRARVHDTVTRAQPGTVLAVDADGIRVQAGEGVVVITELQRAGAKRLSSSEFIRGHKRHDLARFGA